MFNFPLAKFARSAVTWIVIWLIYITQLSDNILDVAAEVVRRASYEKLLEATSSILRSIWEAAFEDIGSLPILRNAVKSNEVNKATLQMVWFERTRLFRFLVELVECAKGFVPASSLDGAGPPNDPRIPDNELDMSQTMNRHAVICQLQRLLKSLIFILGVMTSPATPVHQIKMGDETELMTDAAAGLTIHVAPPPLPRSEKKTTEDEELVRRRNLQQEIRNEKWLFVNGIAGEKYWLYLACRKIATTFSREVTGVLNRGDGMLWDLIECGGERSTGDRGKTSSQDDLIQRTASSVEAQESLMKQLEGALKEAKTKGGRHVGAHVVMIAHSQGCLLLRLVLDELVTSGRAESLDTSENLSVFTFGNPSIHWKVEGMSSDSARHYLSSHSARTEHFANEEDFVASLGVLRSYQALDDGDAQKRGYSSDVVFVNRESTWKNGHMFGAQYSLDPYHYRKTPDSWLLACKNLSMVKVTEQKSTAVPPVGCRATTPTVP
ncbi:hypothetical protein MKZ38_009266 [Zalerion maritima]|uniref:Uncharacterized protein n=1 Tax=Zalerion maritima TaxID=339359 RepID=A0AAD5RG26_9PEZI|nr:hypothetical protein MKZ38_009266 [Zalerion maritima]